MIWGVFVRLINRIMSQCANKLKWHRKAVSSLDIMLTMEGNTPLPTQIIVPILMDVLLDASSLPLRGGVCTSHQFGSQEEVAEVIVHFLHRCLYSPHKPMP